MAFEDGFTHKVTVIERPDGSQYTSATASAGVEVRIYPLGVEEIQVLSDAFSTSVSHRLTASLSSGIERGHKLLTTEYRTAAGWSAVQTERTYDVKWTEEAVGGPSGAHHLRGLLSEASESD